MLTLLKIRNLALVDQLLWEPSSGFICITGETGAGKSVIIGAIRLALGERADKRSSVPENSNAAWKPCFISRTHPLCTPS